MMSLARFADFRVLRAVSIPPQAIDANHHWQVSKGYSTMKTKKGVSKSLHLGAGVTLFTIAIYALSHIGFGLRELREDRPSHFPPFQSALHVAAAKDLGGQENDRPGYGSWFNGCKYVYIDGGSNMGLQIRKIFEPELYPDDRRKGERYSCSAVSV